MAYARFSQNSDLYVYLSASPPVALLCVRCILTPPDFAATTTADMIAHVQRHIGAGHKVPTDLTSDLGADQMENDATITASGQ